MTCAAQGKASGRVVNSREIFSEGLAMRFPTPLLFCLALSAPSMALAADGPAIAGIPVDFILFAATLLGVALFHHYVLKVALAGLATLRLR